MAQVSEKVLAWLYNVLREYRDPQRTYSDSARVLSLFSTLSPRTEVFTYDHGASVLLLTLSGTLPVVFRGTTYRFPVKLWVPQAYPHEAPFVFVIPERDMLVRPGQHVAVDGRVYHPYLRDWSSLWDRASLTEFLAILQQVFSREPPVTSQAQQQIHQGVPNPVLQSPSSSPSGPPQLPPKQRWGEATQVPTPPQEGPSSPPHRPPKPREERPPISLMARTDGPPLPPLPQELSASTVANLDSKFQALDIGSRKSALSAFGAVYDPRYQHDIILRSQLPYGSGHNQQNISHPKQTGGAPATPVQQNAGSGPFVPENHLAGATFPQIPDQQRQQLQQQPPLQPDWSRGNPQNNNRFQQQHYDQRAFLPEQPSQTSAQPAIGLHTGLAITAQPRKPPTDLLSDPFDVSLPDSKSAHSTLPAPPIPPNPEREQLLGAVSVVLAQQIENMVSQNLAAVAPLQAQQTALLAAKQQLEAEIRQIEQLDQVLSRNETILHHSIRECDQTIVTANSKTQPPIDEVLLAPTLVATQLWTLCAEEAACRGAMYVLQRAVDKGRLNGNDLAKHMRALGRECFLKMALAKKCARGMGLEIIPAK